MRIRTVATAFCLVLLLNIIAPQVLAQDMPQECKEAQEIRSPQGQVDMLTLCLESGKLRGDEKATALKQRSIAYMHLGQHPRAIQDINQAIKLRPDDSDNFYLRGFAYRFLSQYQQALDDSNRAINLDPNFAAAYANRAFVHKALGNDGQARSDARRALELDPKVKVPRF